MMSWSTYYHLVIDILKQHLKVVSKPQVLSEFYSKSNLWIQVDSFETLRTNKGKGRHSFSKYMSVQESEVILPIFEGMIKRTKETL